MPRPSCSSAARSPRTASSRAGHSRRLEPRRHWRTVIFLIAATANRPPFDLVEAEQEIVGGFHTEYSSIRFALLAEFMNVVTMSAIIGSRCSWAAPHGPRCAEPRTDLAADLVLPEGARLRVHLRVVPSDAAPPPLRPAHGPGMEGADPARVRLAADHRPATGSGVDWNIGDHVVEARRRPARSAGCCSPRPSASPNATASKQGTPSDGLPQGLHRHVQDALQRAASATEYPRQNSPSPSASTAVTCSTGTRTAWRSASGASVRGGVQGAVPSTSAAPTTRSTMPSGERYALYEIDVACAASTPNVLCVEACPTFDHRDEDVSDSASRPTDSNLHQGQAARR